MNSILERWKLTEQELTLIVDQNPSLRGYLLGYVGEYKLRALFAGHPLVTGFSKPDDHRRDKDSKNDLTVNYREHRFTVEVKSLQTNSIIRNTDGTMSATAQVDASDRRLVILSDGTTLETTCLLAGQFDVLAVNIFQFRQEWEFAFILNRDLPRSRHKRYTLAQQNELLATLVRVNFPLQPPFSLNPFDLFDLLLSERGFI